MAKRIYLSVVVLLLAALLNTVGAQVLPGAITQKDFERQYKVADTAYGAVVLSDVGQTEFTGKSGTLSLSFKRHCVIHILNRTGLDVASVYIPLYAIGSAEESLVDLKATTYNRVENKIEIIQLDKKSIFKEKRDRHTRMVKFTFPGVKAGSIIEFSYHLRSDFATNMQPWKFQGRFPVLFSQYEARIPNFLYYIFQIKGSVAIEHTERKFSDYYNIGYAGTNIFNDVGIEHKWIARNVSAFKEEDYISASSNYISGVEFYLSQYRFPNRGAKNVMGSWADVSGRLMEDGDFGADLNGEKKWLQNANYGLSGKLADSLANVRSIYNFVQDNFLASGSAGIWLSSSLEDVFNNKKGFTADINLLLVAILKHEKIKAYPVILKRREEGYLDEIYPLVNKCDYVVCVAEVAGKQYFLDASQNGLAFGQLPLACYNGHARIIYDDIASAITLLADSVVEQNVTSVFMKGIKNGEWEGRITAKLGMHGSAIVRSGYNRRDTSFLKIIQASYDEDMQVKNQKVVNVERKDIPVNIEFDFNFVRDDETVYFNPMLGRGLKENYFKAAERSYPIEMPYCVDEIFVMNFELPGDYLVEELPKSARVNLSEDGGFFEYIINVSETTIQLRSRIKLNKAFYTRDRYTDLREFFGYVIKKHAEPIVLKKKK